MSKNVRITDTQGAIDYLSPMVVFVFGMGWLVGAEASWFWGLIVMGVGAGWQASRNMRGNRPTKFVVDESGETREE